MQTVPVDFARRNGLNKRRQEIVLMNEEEKSWESEVRNSLYGQVFICQSWRSFCTASKLEVGDSCTFKLLRNAEKPVFRLCSRSKVERKKKIQSTEVNIVDKTGKDRFVMLTPTPNSLELGKQVSFRKPLFPVSSTRCFFFCNFESFAASTGTFHESEHAQQTEGNNPGRQRQTRVVDEAQGG